MSDDGRPTTDHRRVAAGAHKRLGGDGATGRRTPSGVDRRRWSVVGRRSSVVGLPLPVSVVVPARDESGTIDGVLEALLGQREAADEILVVDAGSRDDTAARVGRWSARYPQIRLLSIGPAYPGEARNAGIAAVRHAW